MEKKTIILVEDEPDIRSLYSEVLTSAGYDVITAVDGAAGLDIAQSRPWDLMLLDVIMPKLDGIALLKLLRQNPQTKGNPIILLSNLDNENLITNAFEYGADGYLMKDQINPDQLILEVKNYLAAPVTAA